MARLFAMLFVLSALVNLRVPGAVFRGIRRCCKDAAALWFYMRECDYSLLYPIACCLPLYEDIALIAMKQISKYTIAYEEQNLNPAWQAGLHRPSSCAR